MNRFGPLLLALAVAAAASGPAPARAQAADPPYEQQLQRLSEILGALHYLRELCGAAEGQQWREEMQALIEAEEPTPERRARLVDRFNLGYSGFASVYRNCTEAATLAIDRYMREGSRISQDIIARYGR